MKYSRSFNAEVQNIWHCMFSHLVTYKENSFCFISENWLTYLSWFSNAFRLERSETKEKVSNWHLMVSKIFLNFLFICSVCPGFCSLILWLHFSFMNFQFWQAYQYTSNTAVWHIIFQNIIFFLTEWPFFPLKNLSCVNKWCVIRKKNMLCFGLEFCFLFSVCHTVPEPFFFAYFLLIFSQECFWQNHL